MPGVEPNYRRREDDGASAVPPAAPQKMSVVVPTRDRPELLRRCLQAVQEQVCEVPFEILVVNDGVEDLSRGIADEFGLVKILRGPRRGPAAARNVGVAAAGGDIVLFTDDDVVPNSGWVQAALSAFQQQPEVLGVVGKVESPSFDPLFEHSVVSDGAVGNFVTCNAGYRRFALQRVYGFDEGYPYPAAEDRDLGHRVSEIGPIEFVPEMVVVHNPRPIRMVDVWRRGRHVESEWRLYRRHPQLRPPRWSVRWGPVIRIVRHWQKMLMDEEVVRRSPYRAGRLLLLAAGQVAGAISVTLRRWRKMGAESKPVARRPATTPRVAWIGPVPSDGGGVPGCARMLIQGLSDLGCQVDCFLAGRFDDVCSAPLPSSARAITCDSGWRFDRWYSRRATTKVLTGLLATAWERRRLACLLVDQHRRWQYDVVYQFSTIELFGLRRRLSSLPPLIVQPETHMAGELRWVRRERHIASRCEPRLRRMVVEGLLTLRSWRQRRDIAAASRIIAISHRFAEELASDYGVSKDKISLVRNPIDLERFEFGTERRPSPPWTIVFVGRISARKGVETLVELSHRLDDLHDVVCLEIVGGPTLWSDYRPLLSDLNPRTSRYLGHLEHREVARVLARAHILIHPAKYEPFGLTVAEALACGVPVVASDQVGAIEGVSPDCCKVVVGNDAAAYERPLREMLDSFSSDGQSMSASARSNAERLYSIEEVASATVRTIRECCIAGSSPAHPLPSAEFQVSE